MDAGRAAEHWMVQTMTVSSIPCPTCKTDRKFFSQPDGKTIKGDCGHVIANQFVRNPGKLWETALARKKSQARVRK
jgi:hypothetical protein